MAFRLLTFNGLVGSIRSHLLFVGGIMWSHTQIQVCDSSCSLLFDNWFGEGALVDLFGLYDMVSLRLITLRESLAGGTWNFSLLSNFLEADTMAFLLKFDFSLGQEQDSIFWKPTSSGFLSYLLLMSW